jgi:probable phosphoglycerate mutase
VQIDDGLREVRFGVQEGQPMSDWFPDWMAGRFMPDGAESFATLRHRAVTAVNFATSLPPLVLVVAHGALFRALRTAMAIEPVQRTPNAVPIWCDPPMAEARAWTLNYCA